MECRSRHTGEHADVLQLCLEPHVDGLIVVDLWYNTNEWIAERDHDCGTSPKQCRLSGNYGTLLNTTANVGTKVDWIRGVAVLDLGGEIRSSAAYQQY